jgi:hypothetical protein
MPNEIHSPFHRGCDKSLCPTARPFKYFAEMERNEFSLGVQIVTIINFSNEISKLPIIRYHTRGS